MGNTNIAEFENGRRVFRITKERFADTPVSPILCSNFIEVGFGWQVESMWSEMFYNRSFEKPCPFTPAAYHWYGGWNNLGNDWSEQEFYHSGYDHPDWFACPAQERSSSMSPDSTFLVEKATGYALTVTREEGGIHGKHCLQIYNFEPERMCGVAQSSKYLRCGEKYNWRGWLKNIGNHPVHAEIRFYPAGINAFHQEPIAVLPLGELSRDGQIYSAVLDNPEYEGWAVFSLFITPGKVLADAFSLKPANTLMGWRPEVVEGLKRVNPGVIRFPGGCFASFHDWRNAIGSIDSRIPEDSYFWGDVNYNDVGTDEFLQLCELLGCQAMLVVNMFHPGKKLYNNSRPNGNALEPEAHGGYIPDIASIEDGIECARQWVEYCNGSVDTPMGKKRAENGHPKPYGVHYFEMDNEAFRWFAPADYAALVFRYSQAMKAVDPSIQIGMTSYYEYGDNVESMLDICGEHVDFLADRVCAPDNIARKVDVVRRYNASHKHQIYYCDTEAHQARPNAMAPFTAQYYQDHDIDFCRSRRTWLYALTLVGNLMNYHRYGGIVQFMCFNNLCNTTGQSCIEVDKKGYLLPMCGQIFERMSRTEAAWALKIDGYEPDSLKSVEIQAAWNQDESKLILYLLNKCDQDTSVTIDFSNLGRTFSRQFSTRMSAESGAVQETMKSQGNVHYDYQYAPVSNGVPVTYSIPAFSFTEIVIA